MQPLLVRWLGAVRLSISVLVGLGLSLAFNWPKPEWAAIASIVLNMPFLGASLERGLTRLLGTIVGALVGMWMVTAFAEHQTAFLVFAFVFCTWAMYMGTGSLYPYSFMLCAVTALIVALPVLSAGQQAPELAWSGAYYRTLETSLGIGVSLVVNSVLWPRYAGAELRVLMGRVLSQCGRLTDGYLDDQMAARPSTIGMAKLASQTANQLITCGPLFGYAQRDTHEVRRRRVAYDVAILDLRRLLGAVAELQLAHQPPPPSPDAARLLPHLAKMGALVQTELAALQEGWNRRRADFGGVPDFQAQDKAFIAVYEQVRRLSSVTVHELVRLLGVRTALNDIWQVLGELRRSLAAANGNWKATVLAISDPGLPTFGADTDRRRLRLAVNAGVAVTAGAAVFLFTNAPGGISVPVAALFFVVITVLSRYQSPFSLMGGMVLGSVISAAMLFWIFPRLAGFASLAAALLPVLLFWGWLSGNPKYTGPAMLGCILFIYGFNITEQQSYNTQDFVSLIIGQLLGTSLAAVCINTFWPQTPHLEFRRQLARFWNTTGELLAEIGTPPPRTAAVHRRILKLVQLVLALPSQAGMWLSDFNQRRLKRDRRERLCEHLAAAQSLALQLRALAIARENLRAEAVFMELQPQVQQMRQAALDEMAHFAKAFESGRPPPADTDLSRDFEELVLGLERVRASGHTLRYDAYDIATFVVVVTRYEDVVRGLLAARHALRDGDYFDLGRGYFL